MILARQEFDIVLDEIPFMDELLGRRDLYRLSIPETPDGSETPIAARRADALERIAGSTSAISEQAVNGGDRCTLHIHTDSNTLQEDDESAEAQLETGGCVSAETSRRLACDCGVVHWLEDKTGMQPGHPYLTCRMADRLLPGPIHVSAETCLRCHPYKLLI